MLGRLCNLLLGLSLSLFCLESFCRFFRDPGQLHHDPQLGICFAPGSVVRFTDEGFGVSHWHQNGIRGEAPRVGEPSILVLGDSFTEACHVHDDEVFTRLAQIDLTLTGSPLRIYNCGRAGHSLADFVGRGPAYLERLRPAWTVVVVRREDLEEGAWGKGPSAHFIVNGNNVETAVPQIGRSRLRDLMQATSKFILLPEFAYDRFLLYRNGIEQEPRLFSAGSKQNETKLSAPLGGPLTGPFGDGSQRSGRDFPIEHELDLLSKVYNRRVTVLYLSEFDPEATTATTPLEKRIQAHCQKQGLSFAATSQANAEHFRSTGRVPYGAWNTKFNTGHMNPDGHRVAARVLSQELHRLRNNGFF
ncbi:MAG: hypothetical protein AMXMBFR33_45860 [Candidatus Xenobia bacterium]